ncbi:MAG: glycosyltransferase [Bacteroidota bacterium]
MNIVLFYQSLLSDTWSHGNTPFMRGVINELIIRGHSVKVLELENNSSLSNLLATHGEHALSSLQARYPILEARFYTIKKLDLTQELSKADMVIVHESNSPELVEALGNHRASHAYYRLLFHDTYHHSITHPKATASYNLTHYDGVLADCAVIRNIYLKERRAQKAWTWHKSADIRVFHPYPYTQKEGDLVWFGDWNEKEGLATLEEFFIRPVKELALKASIYGINYPDHVLEALEEAGIKYAGWIPNYEIPEVFAKFRIAMHLPAHSSVDAFLGIPSRLLLEALACGIPLVSSPWENCENLFSVGKDFLMAKNGREMTKLLVQILDDEHIGNRLVQHGLNTILKHHTCAHRVDSLLQIGVELNLVTEPKAIGQRMAV